MGADTLSIPCKMTREDADRFRRLRLRSIASVIGVASFVAILTASAVGMWKSRNGMRALISVSRGIPYRHVAGRLAHFEYRPLAKSTRGASGGDTSLLMLATLAGAESAG